MVEFVECSDKGLGSHSGQEQHWPDSLVGKSVT